MIEDMRNRKTGLEDIFINSWNIYKNQFKTILLIILIIYVPVNLILSLLPASTAVDPQEALRDIRNYMNLLRVLEGFIGIIATMAIAFVVEDRVFGKYTETGEALKRSLSRWASALGTSFLGGLIIIGLSLLLVIPGIIWGVYYIFIVYVVALRGIGGKKALNYSKSLVKGDWWKVFGITALFQILGFLVGWVVGSFSWFLPENMLLSIVSDTLIDVVSSYFTIANIILFLGLDYSKKGAPGRESSTDM